jgi:hypothetical protein
MALQVARRILGPADPALRSPRLLLAALLALAGTAPEAAAQTEAKLVDPDGAPGDHFGWSVDLDGTRAVVGAPNSGVAGANAGKALVYDFTGGQWQLVATLLPSVSPPGGRFGYSIGVSGDRVIVGAPYLNEPTATDGRAYVFERSGSVWNEVFVIGLPAEDYSAISVDISGTRAAIGAPLQSPWDEGIIYLLSRPGGGWTQDGAITGTPSITSVHFGSSLSVFGLRVLVGAPSLDQPFMNSGAAYLYDVPVGSPTWAATLLPPTSNSEKQFGVSVSLGADRAIVGANLLTGPGSSGAGYIYEPEAMGGAWSLVKKVVMPDVAAPPDNVGWSVALAGDFAAIGAIGAGGATPSSGGVLTRFRVNGAWQPSVTLFASDGIANQSFGWDVAASSGCTIVGAPSDDDNGALSGSAYVYCGIPTPITFTEIDVICCVEIPGPGPVLIEVGYGTVVDPVTITRKVTLYFPDGSSSEVKPLEPRDLVPGATNREPITVAVPDGAPPGEYAIVVDWTDDNGEHSETVTFTMTATEVPALRPPGKALLALVLAATAVALLARSRAGRSRSYSSTA